MNAPAILFCFFATIFCTGQTLIGNLKDAENGQPIPFATIFAADSSSTTADANGRFTLQFSRSGTWQIRIVSLGFATKTERITVLPNQTLTRTFALQPKTEELNTVVVTAGKNEQRAEEVTVSIDVLKPNLIQEKNTIALQDAFNQSPGVNVTDDQANIRSGSGWSFGAGSRVLMLVDDMPMMSPDAGQIQWKLLPNEAVQQMEVVKGASSALYGTSALNGLINVRTISPSITPKTEVILYGGVYNTPKREELKWWDGQRGLGGFSLLHAKKIGTTDLVLSALLQRDQGYRYGEVDHRNRLNAKVQFHPKNIAGLSWGLNSSVLYAEGGDALLWQSYQYGYVPRDSQATASNGWDYYIDPNISFARNKTKHMLRGRIMGINNNARTEDVNYENHSTYYYAEYQFQHFLTPDFWLTAGAFGALGYSISEVFAGYHETENGALFVQADKKINRLSLSGGFRYEAYRLDEKAQSKPVLRAGINYKMGRATFVRASYGGGYRFPSMAEVYTNTKVGAAGVFPNHNLNPESGWSAEVGIKQGIQIGTSWRGFLDVAGFVNRYDNMTEFSFGFWGNSTNPFENMGFKSLNVGPTRIIGLETTITADGKLGNLGMRLLAGYAYMNPVALNPDQVYAQYTDIGGQTDDVSYASTSSNAANNILKYRYQHLAKADVLFSYAKISLGFSLKYNDFMQNIDTIFVNPSVGPLISPGMQEARQTLNRGDLVFDARILFRLTPQWQLACIVDNVGNREVMPRPAQLGPPRKLTLQLKYQL